MKGINILVKKITTTDYLISKALFNSLLNLKVFRFTICPAKLSLLSHSVIIP